jgi:hypothetical protein
MKALGFVVAMAGLTVILALPLYAIGAPLHVFTVVTLVVCLAVHLWMGHGDPNGEKLLETAQRAAAAPRN